MVVRKTSRTQIQIEPFVEIADLFGLNTVLIHLFNYGAAPRRVITSTRAFGQFDNLATVVCSRKFIRGGQTADAGAEDDD
jgi:hypothetical protein